MLDGGDRTGGSGSLHWSLPLWTRVGRDAGADMPWRDSVGGRSDHHGGAAPCAPGVLRAGAGSDRDRPGFHRSGARSGRSGHGATRAARVMIDAGAPVVSQWIDGPASREGLSAETPPTLSAETSRPLSAETPAALSAETSAGLVAACSISSVAAVRASRSAMIATVGAGRRRLPGLTGPAPPRSPSPQPGSPGHRFGRGPGLGPVRGQPATPPPTPPIVGR